MLNFRVLLLGCQIGALHGEFPFAQMIYSLTKLPETNFNCANKVLGNYYADSETQCKMFHVCVQVLGVGVQDFRFLCPNGTAFDQEAQICTDWGDVDCHQVSYHNGIFDIFRINQSKSRVTEEEGQLKLQNLSQDNNEEIFKGSHSSNFFSNKNHGLATINAAKKSFNNYVKQNDYFMKDLYYNISQSVKAIESTTNDEHRNKLLLPEQKTISNIYKVEAESFDIYTKRNNNIGNNRRFSATTKPFQINEYQSTEYLKKKNKKLNRIVPSSTITYFEKQQNDYETTASQNQYSIDKNNAVSSYNKKKNQNEDYSYVATDSKSIMKNLYNTYFDKYQQNDTQQEKNVTERKPLRKLEKFSPIVQSNNNTTPYSYKKIDKYYLRSSVKFITTNNPILSTRATETTFKTTTKPNLRRNSTFVFKKEGNEISRKFNMTHSDLSSSYYNLPHNNEKSVTEASVPLTTFFKKITPIISKNSIDDIHKQNKKPLILRKISNDEPHEKSRNQADLRIKNTTLKTNNQNKILEKKITNEEPFSRDQCKNGTLKELSDFASYKSTEKTLITPVRCMKQLLSLNEADIFLTSSTIPTTQITKKPIKEKLKETHHTTFKSTNPNENTNYDYIYYDEPKDYSEIDIISEFAKLKKPMKI